MEFIKYYLSVMFLTIGVFVICGLIVGLCKKLFYSLAGRAGYGLVIATSVIGTPIHELGHALMCVIFRHRIDEMVLWQPSDPDGVLGYVSHSYNKKNLWHVIGNLFIGLGPIFSGLGVMMLMMFLCFRQALTGYLDSSTVMLSEGAGVFDLFLNGFSIIPSMFADDGVSVWFKIIAVIVMLSVCLHISLSMADIVGSLSAIPVYMAVCLIFSGITWFIGYGCTEAVISGLSMWSLTITALYMIVFIGSLALLLIALIVFAIRRLLNLY